MGCHTWFKTQSKYSFEDLRKIWIIKRKEWIKYWAEVTNNPEHKHRSENGIWWVEEVPKYTQEYFEWCLKVYKRQLRMVENGNIKYAFIDHLYETDEGNLYQCHNNTIYVETIELPHDLFRIGGYPEDQLFSFQDTIKFINSNKEKISFHFSEEETIKRLDKFWKENPVGIIHFG